MERRHGAPCSGFRCAWRIWEPNAAVRLTKLGQIVNVVRRPGVTESYGEKLAIPLTNLISKAVPHASLLHHTLIYEIQPLCNTRTSTEILAFDFSIVLSNFFSLFSTRPQPISSRVSCVNPAGHVPKESPAVYFETSPSQWNGGWSVGIHV